MERNIRITKNGLPLDESLYTLDLNNKIFKSDKDNISIYCPYNGFTFHTGSNCIFDTGSDCIFDTGSNCKFNTESYCKFITRSDCIFYTGSDCEFDTGSDCEFNEKEVKLNNKKIKLPDNLFEMEN